MIYRPTDLERIKAGIKDLRPGDMLGFKCFNRAEAEDLRAALSPEEQPRVHFTWLEPSKQLIPSGNWTAKGARCFTQD